MMMSMKRICLALCLRTGNSDLALSNPLECAQTAIELEECGLGEGVHGLVADGPMTFIHVAKRLDVVSRIQLEASSWRHTSQMVELADGGFAARMLAHLWRLKAESLIHFGVFIFFGGV